MLRELRIKNIAIIDNLSVTFGKGLNVMTGETGAGKSIIVDALSLALGERAQTDRIKAGAQEGSVQAFFELDNYSLLADIGINFSEGIVLRRVLNAGGKSKAYINDSMVTLQTLSDIGSALVDIHSQHEHQSLLTPDKQRELLDAYGGLHPLCEQVKTLFHEVQALRSSLSSLEEKTRERERRIDMLNYQVREIDSAELTPGEPERLVEEKKILTNLSKLRQLVESSYDHLYASESSCLEQLSLVINNLRDILPIDASAENTLGLLENARPLLDDAALALREFRERYDFEPDRLEIVEERLENIKNMLRKYGDTIQVVLEFRNNAYVELQDLISLDEKKTGLEQELGGAETALKKAAAALSAAREKASLELAGHIRDLLKSLSFPRADFSISLRRDSDESGAQRIFSTGLDRIEFLFTANPGEPLKPLAKVASGGELSRIMLALKSVLIDAGLMPVLIFDEVDAGTGGKTAERIGQKLKDLSSRHQVLCLTHLPQIAKFADNHFKIEKQTRQKSVLVSISELNGQERQKEVARMLSGTVTDISLKHAAELLSG